MIQKIKNLFKKKQNEADNMLYADPNNISIEEWKFINHPFLEEKQESLEVKEVTKPIYNEELYKQAE